MKTLLCIVALVASIPSLADAHGGRQRVVVNNGFGRQRIVVNNFGRQAVVVNPFFSRQAIIVNQPLLFPSQAVFVSPFHSQQVIFPQRQAIILQQGGCIGGNCGAFFGGF